MLPCTDFSSCFCMERFYFYWKVMVCILFPLESSMYFISCACKAQNKEVTQQLNYLIKIILFFNSPWSIFGGRAITWGMLLLQFRYTSGKAQWSCLCQCMHLHVGTDGDDYSRKFWPASTQPGLNKQLVPFLTGAPRDNITLQLTNSM